MDTDPVRVFQDNYNRLSIDTIDLVDEIYAPDVVFADPIHSFEGRETLKKYLASLYDGVAHCHFEWEPVVREEGRAAVPWIMEVEHARFRKGRRVRVPGLSLIRFADQVTHHQDYFDMGALIYERVPGLGSVIRGIKARL